MLQEAEDKIARLRCAADLLVAAEFWGEGTNDKQERMRHAVNVSGHYVEHGPTAEFETKAEKERRGQRMFHWPLEFPEVIVKRGGFDAFIGNPPFVGGRRLLKTVGETYRNGLTNAFDGATTNADLVAFFFRRAFIILTGKGTFGLLGTKSITESHTCDVGLRWLCDNGGSIFRATPTARWPGTAGVVVAHVHATKDSSSVIGPVLNAIDVEAISPTLTASTTDFENPMRLNRFHKDYTQGTMVYGDGFVISPQTTARHDCVCMSDLSDS